MVARDTSPRVLSGAVGIQPVTMIGILVLAAMVLARLTK